MESNSVLVTVISKDLGQLDIKISRDIPIKKIIINLFEAISKPLPEEVSFYIKAISSNKLIQPHETLEESEIYDGEILHLL